MQHTLFQKQHSFGLHRYTLIGGTRMQFFNILRDSHTRYTLKWDIGKGQN